MKFIVFYLQLINSLEGLGMFFSSAALIRRLRKHSATDDICHSSFSLQVLTHHRELSLNVYYVLILEAPAPLI